MPDLTNRPRDEKGRLLPANDAGLGSAFSADDAKRDPELDDLEIPASAILGSVEVGTPSAAAKPDATSSVPPERETPAAQRPAPATSARPKSHHDPRDVAAAKMYFPQATDAQIEALSQEQLWGEIENGRQQAAAWRAWQFQNNQPQQARQPEPEPAAPESTKAQDYLTQIENDDAYPDEYKKEVIGRLRQVDEIAELKKQIAELKADKQKSAADAYTSRFEAICQQCPEVYGSGSQHVVDSMTDLEVGRRQIMDFLIRNYGLKGVAQEDWEARFKTFHKYLFGTPAKAKKQVAAPEPERRVAPQVNGHAANGHMNGSQRTQQVQVQAREPVSSPYSMDEWEQAGLGLPTDRQIDDLPPGPERAERAIAQKAKDMNLPMQEDQPRRRDELAGFFD